MLRFFRKKSTIEMIYLKYENVSYRYYFQLSLVDPWLLPKIDKNFCKGRITLVGWLFIYFGWNNSNGFEVFK